MGFRKNRVDLIGDSVSELVLATKYLDGLVMVSQVKQLLFVDTL